MTKTYRSEGRLVPQGSATVKRGRVIETAGKLHPRLCTVPAPSRASRMSVLALLDFLDEDDTRH